MYVFFFSSPSCKRILKYQNHIWFFKGFTCPILHYWLVTKKLWDSRTIGSLYRFLRCISHPYAPGQDFMHNMSDHTKKTALWYITEGEPGTCSFFKIYCNSRCWNKWKVDGKITSNIPSNSPLKVQTWT